MREREIGSGAGANLGHSPPSGERFLAVEPGSRIARFARRRIAGSLVSAELRANSAQSLPCEAGGFVGVLGAWTVRDIPDGLAATSAIPRVAPHA